MRGVTVFVKWNFWNRFEERACFRLAQARLCLECDVIFEAKQCPLCGERSFVPLTRWILPLPARQKREQAGSRTVEGRRRNGSPPSR